MEERVAFAKKCGIDPSMLHMDDEGIVLESVINLAHRLNLKTIAEGVETSEEYEKVKQLGCDYIQGYYFSKPLPLDKYEEYIKKHS